MFTNWSLDLDRVTGTKLLAPLNIIDPFFFLRILKFIVTPGSWATLIFLLELKEFGLFLTLNGVSLFVFMETEATF